MIDDRITILVTSSPSLRHPSTEMIRRTIKLVRKQLPGSKILILQDGVRPEQEYLRGSYERYKTNLKKWAATQDKIEVVEFKQFYHQAGMIRRGLKYVTTEQLLFIEHDFPVVGDIPWKEISNLITFNQASLVRFYLEPNLEPAHNHMFLDKEPFDLGGVPVIRTGQWSQRPHLASTAFYRTILRRYVSFQVRNYLEDTIHGHFGGAFDRDPVRAWNQSKMAIYHPQGSISRCRHLDGRLTEEKYHE